MTPPRTSSVWSRRALLVVALALVLAAAVTLAPMWLPVVLAAWLAILGQPVIDRFTGHLGGRRGVAGAIVLAVFLALFLPLVFLVASLTHSAVELVRQVASSGSGKAALESLVTGEGGSAQPVDWSVASLLQLARAHGQTAWQVLRRVAGATGVALVSVFVFLWGSYAFLTQGRRLYGWIEANSPLEPQHVRKLADAFAETGRGLLIGTGLTAASQALLATVAYAALGVPRALIFGLLTFFAAALPSVGTGLVWAPIALGLFLTGAKVKAIVLVAIGVLVIGTIDNLLRPFFSRYGELRMHPFLLVLAVFGGLAVFGAAGILLGPLFVRLAMAAIELATEARRAEAEERKGQSANPSTGAP